MPTYEEQLMTYRSQLAQAAATSASSVPIQGSSPGMGATVGLAFNTMMSDLGSLASMVSSNPITPYVSDVSPAVQYHQPSLMGSPGPSMRHADHQYMQTQYLADKLGSGVSSAAAIAGSLLGPGAMAGYAGWGVGSRILGGMGGFGNVVKGGAKVGRAIGMGAGNILAGTAGASVGGAAGLVGGGALAAVGAAAIPMGIAYAAESGVEEMFSQMGARSNFQDILQQGSWRITGGKGFNRAQRKDISGSLVRGAINDRDMDFGDYETILQQGTQLGMFNASTDSDDFKRKFRELKDNLKSVMKTMRVSAEEGLQLMSELKQGGFSSGAAQGGAALHGAGLGVASGFSAREMHEVGMRGAAAFRGTGIATGFGFQMAQQNLAAVKTMQQQGMISPETVNQLGGTLGAAQTMTQGFGQFTQSSFGRAMGAVLMDPSGGVNQGRVNMMLQGRSISDVMANAQDQGFKPWKANAVEVAEMWGGMNPMQAQALRASTMLSAARQMRPGATGEDLRDAFRTVATRHFGLSVPQTQQQWSFLQNAPELMQQQSRALRDESRRAAGAKYDAQNTWAENLGVAPAWRQVRRGIGTIARPFSAIGEGVSEAVEDAGMWWRDEERVTEARTDLVAFLGGATDERAKVKSTIGEKALGMARAAGVIRIAHTDEELKFFGESGQATYENKYRGAWTGKSGLSYSSGAGVSKDWLEKRSSAAAGVRSGMRALSRTGKDEYVADPFAKALIESQFGEGTSALRAMREYSYADKDDLETDKMLENREIVMRTLGSTARTIMKSDAGITKSQAYTMAGSELARQFGTSKDRLMSLSEAPGVMEDVDASGALLAAKRATSVQFTSEVFHGSNIGGGRFSDRMHEVFARGNYGTFKGYLSGKITEPDMLAAMKESGQFTAEELPTAGRHLATFKKKWKKGDINTEEMDKQYGSAQHQMTMGKFIKNSLLPSKDRTGANKDEIAKTMKNVRSAKDVISLLANREDYSEKDLYGAMSVGAAKAVMDIREIGEMSGKSDLIAFGEKEYKKDWDALYAKMGGEGADMETVREGLQKLEVGDAYRQEKARDYKKRRDAASVAELGARDPASGMILKSSLDLAQTAANLKASTTALVVASNARKFLADTTD